MSIEKQIRLALLRRRTNWTGARTAPANEHSRRSFEKLGGDFYAACTSGEKSDPESCAFHLLGYHDFLTDELARIVAKEVQNHEMPPSAARFDQARRMKARGYYAYLSELAVRELEYVANVIARCEAIIESGDARKSEALVWEESDPMCVGLRL